jgi:hypothetical protein
MPHYFRNETAAHLALGAARYVKLVLWASICDCKLVNMPDYHKLVCTFKSLCGFRVTLVVYTATQSSSCRAKSCRTRPQLTNSNGSSKYGQQWSIMVEATVAPGLDANSSYRGGMMCTKPHVSWICHNVETERLYAKFRKL